MSSRSLTIAGLAIVAVCTSAAAFSKPSDARVTFHAVGPAGLKIEGSTTELDVTEDSESVVITVALRNLQTGIDMRDRHMREKYLEVDKYPQARLIIARSSLKLPAPGAQLKSEAEGTLSLHGTSRPTVAQYEAKSDGTGYAVDGRLRVNMTQVGIAVPVYLGVSVKPDVDVDVHFRISGP